MTSRAGHHALIIGGSLAGLLAARVLADHFERVTLVERDQFPMGPEPRKGLPQARHVHILLIRGQQILKELFPGLETELAAAGAPEVDWTSDLGWFSFGGWAPRVPSGYLAQLCSRDLLEWEVRRRLALYPQVRFLTTHEVIGLLASDNNTRVTGVRVRLRNQAHPQIVQAGLAAGDEEELYADLLVDASGRESRLPGWLEVMGYEPPQETRVNSFLGYASRLYEIPAGFQADWKGLLVRATPPASTRGGGIYPIEGNRWMVTLGGAGRDYPPTDEAGFLDFARSLPVPLLYDAIQQAQPLTPLYGYRRTENRLRHYERLERWPENLVVIGDAVCAFNPVYGQGMTVAALGALALGECLRDQSRRKPGGDLTGLARRFQSRLGRVVATPWLMATSEDFRYPQTEGGRPGWTTRLMHRYMNHVLHIANQDPPVQRVFLQVLHLLKPPLTLFQLDIIAKVLKRWVGQHRPLAAPPPSPHLTANYVGRELGSTRN